MIRFTEFQKSFSQFYDRITTSSVRPIVPNERLELESGGNVVSGELFVGEEKIDFKRIRNNVFLGKCVLVASGIGGDSPDSAIITNNTFTNVFIDVTSSIIRDNAMISFSFIGSNCFIVNNGIIGGNFSKKNFGLKDSEIVLGEETGSRSILRHPEMTLENVSESIVSRSGQSEWNSAVKSSLENISKKFSSPLTGAANAYATIIGNNNKLIKNSQVLDVFVIGSDNCITASELRGCVVTGGNNTISNSVIIDSTIANDSIIDSFSFVENSVICDFVKVSVHAKVVHSLIGSYSGVESGECISSLVGPFVGFHHQSLLIATYWPSGRGNVGYGANVGSNHTGKAPDQELLAGEGVFFGLATIIKFPSNFLEAPYSLFASGVVCLPQKISFPFSLINTGSLPAEYPGYNEIIPAWIISDNMFTLIRNEDKFKKRQKKNAKIIYQHEVFRPEIMALVRSARDVLTSLNNSTKQVYTDADIPGLGKNYLRESSRLKAIDTYSFILRWYALRGMYRRIKSSSNEIDSIYEKQSADGNWEFEKSILKSENLNIMETKSLLNEYSKLDLIVANSCVTSKGKDDVRGAKIIGPMYNEFHAPASSHSVCVNARRNAEATQIDVENIISKL